MCYDIKASLEAQLKRAKRFGDQSAVKEIEEKLVPYTDLPIYHASGFQHPGLLIYTDRSPEVPEVSVWGLVPHWVKDGAQLEKLWNRTLNARGETIFEKPSFRWAARHNRCLIYVDGFYEHHHFKGKTYPFYIHRKDMQPMAFAGLWSEWTDQNSGVVKNTFSIVTTRGNDLLASIHNNPKIKGPRMPLILPDELADKWLEPAIDELDVQALQELIQAYPSDELDAYTVHKLRGRDYLGNIPEIGEPVTYPDLVF